MTDRHAIAAAVAAVEAAPFFTRVRTTARTLPSPARATILGVAAITGCVAAHRARRGKRDSRAVTAPASPAAPPGGQAPGSGQPVRLPGSTPAVSPAPSHLAAPTSEWCVRAFGINCYSPRQLEQAYGLPQLYARGLDGRGRTIVIVDAYEIPHHPA